MSYQESAQCKMLATHCVCCGAALVDAVSVEMGIGPDCRNGVFPDNASDADRKAANTLVYEAAISAEKGHIAHVLGLASQLDEMGFEELADKVAKRFREASVRAERDPDIEIKTMVSSGGINCYVVKTPFRRGAKDEFIQAWREIPGRRYDRKLRANVVPETSKTELWDLLIEFFPTKWGKGPKGVFRVPRVPKTELTPVQQELGLV